MTFEHSSSRFFFDNTASAAEGLLLVLLDARETDSDYRFGGLSASQILVSGLHLEGEILNVASKLEGVSGAVRHDE